MQRQDEQQLVRPADLTCASLVAPYKRVQEQDFCFLGFFFPLKTGGAGFCANEQHDPRNTYICTCTNIYAQ